MRRKGGREDGRGDVEREIEKEYEDVESVEIHPQMDLGWGEEYDQNIL